MISQTSTRDASEKSFPIFLQVKNPFLEVQAREMQPLLMTGLDLVQRELDAAFWREFQGKYQDWLTSRNMPALSPAEENKASLMAMLSAGDLFVLPSHDPDISPRPNSSDDRYAVWRRTQALRGELDLYAARVSHLSMNTGALGGERIPASVDDPSFFEVYQRLVARMKTSGELASREKILREYIEEEARLSSERDKSKSVGSFHLGTPAEEMEAFWQASRHRHNLDLDKVRRAVDTYHKSLVSTGDRFKQFYGEEWRTLQSRPPSVANPGRKSSLQVFSPGTRTLFDACHVERSAFRPSVCDDHAGYEFARGENRVRLDIGAVPPPEVTNAYAKPEIIEAHIRSGEEGQVLAANLSNLDEMAWDVAVLAVIAFYTRTDGETPDARFPVLIDDYFEWRNVRAEHRTQETRRQIIARIELLASDAVKIVTKIDLYLPDSATGRKNRTSIITRGAYLDGRTEFWISNQNTRPNLTEDLPDGFLTRLGSWATPFVRNRIMIGIALKRLGEYNLRSQQWERRIGWYVTFQMSIQASKMSIVTTTRRGKTHTEVTPQHSLKMETVLDGAHIPDWRKIALVNPGRIVKQWKDTLATLHKDGFTGEPDCLDGAWDGSDLMGPSGKLIRGGLDRMLSRRYMFRPGPEALKHIQAKNKIATELRKQAARQREARKRNNEKL